MGTIPWMRQNTNWKNMFETHKKGLIPLIHKEFLSKSIQNDLNRTWEKDMNIKPQQRKYEWLSFSKKKKLWSK